MKHRYWTVSRYVALLLAGAALAGCGDGNKKDKAASQVAAKVNKEEISVHQVNHLLQQQRVRPEQADHTSRLVLERLIDQELALQSATEMRLDRDAQVLRQIEAARREIIARAYVERISESVGKPLPEDISRYFNEHPELFKERRIYNLQEVVVEVPPEQVPALRERLAVAKSVEQFVQELKSAGTRVAVKQSVRAAEQLPLASLHSFGAMRDGERMFAQTPTGAHILVLLSSRSEPVDEQRARPAIEQFLRNENKRKFLEADAKRLRGAAKIEYVGRFAEAASSPMGLAPVPTATAAPEAPPASAALDFDSAMGLKK